MSDRQLMIGFTDSEIQAVQKAILLSKRMHVVSKEEDDALTRAFKRLAELEVA